MGRVFFSLLYPDNQIIPHNLQLYGLLRKNKQEHTLFACFSIYKHFTRKNVISDTACVFSGWRLKSPIEHLHTVFFFFWNTLTRKNTFSRSTLAEEMPLRWSHTTLLYLIEDLRGIPSIPPEISVSLCWTRCPIKRRWV